MSNIKIENINVFELEIPSYDEKELNLLINAEEDFLFNPKTDFIEAKIYDESKNLIYSDGDSSDGGIYRNFSILNNDIELNVEKFIEPFNYQTGTYFVLYNFYRKICSDNNFNLPEYFITEVDSSRTEVSLVLKEGSNDGVLDSIKEFIEYRKNSNKFIDFIISFGSDNFLANNIKIKDSEEVEIFVKLYEPLPQNFDINSQALLLLEINSPQGYKISIEREVIDINTNIPLSGPNFNIESTSYSSTDTKELSLDDINSMGVFELKSQLESYLADSKNKLNIDYSKFENFIHFSSAFKRFYNFIQKIKLIQFNGLSIDNKDQDIISSFDGYEYHLYYNEYPRDSSGNLIQFLNNPSQPESEINQINPIILSWYDDFCNKSLLYDDNNLDYLYWNVPEYLREDPENYPYRLFIEMIGHMFDDIWVYIRNIQNLYDGDNRVNFGISKDLLTKLLNNFGLKLYNGSYSNQDLYAAFLGTKTGKLPYLNMTLDAPGEDEEHIEYYIDVPEGELPINDIEYRIFKRLYHNLPYLYKGRGTINVLRTILNIYGIPKDIISINEFGKKTKTSISDSQIIGNTLSSTESLQQVEYSDTIDNKFNKYIEIGVSPQDQINKYIEDNLGEINLGDIIGDIRNFKKGGNQYIKLEEIRNDFMQQYVESYDLVDFVRLAKFLNNSLFKIIKDFVPANSTISSGIIIKQHNLERNKTSPLDVNLEDISHETLMKSSVRNYITSDSNYPADHRSKGSSIEVTSGGTAGAVEKYNTIENHPYYANPSSSMDVRDLKFGADQLIQSWEEYHPSIVGLVKDNRDDQREFYNGEYGKPIIQKSPEICRVHFSNEYTKDFRYKILFVGDGIDITSETGFLSSGISTENGHMEIFVKDSDQTNGLPKMAKYIKINRFSTDAIGNDKFDISSFIKTNEFLYLYLKGVILNIKNEEGEWVDFSQLEPVDGNFKFTFYNVIELYNNENEVNGYLIILNQTETDKVAGYYSPESNSNNIIFKASGDYIWRTNGNGLEWPEGIFETIPQGFFPKNTPPKYQTQFIRGYSKSGYFSNGKLIDSDKKSPIGTYSTSFNIYKPEKDGDAYEGLEYIGPLVKTTSHTIPWFSNGSEGLISIDAADFVELTPQQIGDGPIKFLGAEFDVINGVISLKHNIKVTFPNPSPTSPAKLVVKTKHKDGTEGTTNYMSTTPPGGIDENIKNDDILEITLENAIVPNLKPGEISSLKSTIYNKVGDIIGSFTGSPSNSTNLKLNIQYLNPVIGRIETIAYRPEIIIPTSNIEIFNIAVTSPESSSSLNSSATFKIRVTGHPYTGILRLKANGHIEPGRGSGGGRVEFDAFNGTANDVYYSMPLSFPPPYYNADVTELIEINNLPVGVYNGSIKIMVVVSSNNQSTNDLYTSFELLKPDLTPAGIMYSVSI